MREFTVTTRVDASGLLAGESSGLVVMGREYSYLAVTRTPDGLHLMREEKAVTLQSPIVYLRITVTGDANCEFSFSRDGKSFESLGKGFKAKQGMWIGAKVGVFAIGPAATATAAVANGRGHADYDWFRISLPERSAQTRARVR